MDRDGSRNGYRSSFYYREGSMPDFPSNTDPLQQEREPGCMDPEAELFVDRLVALFHPAASASSVNLSSQASSEQTFSVSETPASSPYQISPIGGNRRRSVDPVGARPASLDSETTIQVNNKEADSLEAVREVDNLSFTTAIPPVNSDAVQPSVPVQNGVSHIDSRVQSTNLDLRDAVPWMNVERWKRLYAWRLVSYFPKMIHRKQKEIVQKFYGRKQALSQVHESKCDAEKLLNMDLETIMRVWDCDMEDSEGEIV